MHTTRMGRSLPSSLAIVACPCAPPVFSAPCLPLQVEEGNAYHEDGWELAFISHQCCLSLLATCLQCSLCSPAGGGGAQEGHAPCERVRSWSFLLHTLSFSSLPIPHVLPVLPAGGEGVCALREGHRAGCLHARHRRPAIPRLGALPPPLLLCAVLCCAALYGPSAHSMAHRNGLHAIQTVLPCRAREASSHAAVHPTPTSTPPQPHP